VRPSRAPATIVSYASIRPGATQSVDPVIGVQVTPGQATSGVRLVPAGEYFVGGTWSAAASFGAPVRYDPAGLVQALSAYPLACLEQTVSRGLPLALLPDGPVAGDQRAARLQATVSSALDRQRYDGGFALWSANGEAEAWLTSYAVEFLLRAKAAGATVPDAAMADALKFLAEAADNDGDSPEELSAQAYRLYVLAMAGKGRPGAARVMAERIERLPTPLAKAQLAAALSLAHDQPRAEAAFATALAAPARRWWAQDYGSAVRDQAAIVVLLKESGLLPDRLTAAVAAMPSVNLVPASLNTQEQAWAAAAAAVLGKDGRPVRVAIDGAERVGTPALTVPVTGTMSARNLGQEPLAFSMGMTGVPVQALPAARAGMRITRKFLNLDGSNLELDKLRQNTVFVMVLEGRAEDKQPHRAMLLQGLPAGWEIAGRLGAGKAPGMPWLDELTETETQPVADDRYAAVLVLTEEKPDFRVAVRVRAVTPGNFELPGAELSDMYRPAVFARQGANRIDVLAAE
jgi:uncharacterized protein YfaS (alpha-2-macroglobulin family)